ncbi:hypothetical protein BGX27_008467 [Mortierella sp. AM989]|nr:hypothetical protein BGX27_008467 [Mortierella sp. AM989]
MTTYCSPLSTSSIQQKECDVLWLYGPLYEVDFLRQQRQHHRHQRKSSHQSEWYGQLEQFEPKQPSQSVDFIVAAASEQTLVTPTETTVIEGCEVPTATSTLLTAPETGSETSHEIVSETAAMSIPVHPLSLPKSHQDATPLNSVIGPTTAQPSDYASNSLEMPQSAISGGTYTNEPPKAILRPTKSALKQQGTRDHIFEELRAFTHSPQYVALTKSLLSIPDDMETSTALSCTRGTRSEPATPDLNNANSAFFLPIFPEPTKYHFRSHDHRRASFPKSSSHSSRLSVNVNLNMNADMQPDSAGSESSSPSSLISSKQLRFSLEVQELIFLPTSPPFRISRARPTRAYSDPSIQTMTCSSFIAPSYIHSTVPSSFYQQHHSSGLISTAAASSSSDNTTTTFIKVQAQDARVSAKGSSNKPYLQQDDDEDRLECNFNDDYHAYFFEDCNDSDFTEDEEDDEFNGVGTGSHRYRLSTKNAIIARRAQIDERHHGHPGMLWKVYTAVTGVKELIAWYGSMVYHSSSM